MNTSEIVDLACRRIIEEKKEQKKLSKEGKKRNKNNVELEQE